MRTTIDIRDDLMQELQRWKCTSYDLGGGSFPFERAWEEIDRLEGEAVADKLELRK
jgi:hypothetical protein